MDDEDSGSTCRCLGADARGVSVENGDEQEISLSVGHDKWDFDVKGAAHC